MKLKRKVDTSRVNQSMVRAAKLMARLKPNSCPWTEYTRMHYQINGNLSPDCTLEEFRAYLKSLEVKP